MMNGHGFSSLYGSLDGMGAPFRSAVVHVLRNTGIDPKGFLSGSYRVFILDFPITQSDVTR